MSEAKIAELEKLVLALGEKLQSMAANGAQPNNTDGLQETSRYQVNIPLPKPINIDGDLKVNLKYFISTWNNYNLASGLHKRPQVEQIAVLLSAIGEEAFKRYENFPLTDADRETATSLLKAIERHMVPETNPRYERAMFNLTSQNETENIDEYVNRLKTMVKTCRYRCNAEECNRDLSDEFVLDKLCISIRDVRLRAKLYDDNRITLEEAINKIRVAELTERQLKEIGGSSSSNADTINKMYSRSSLQQKEPAKQRKHEYRKPSAENAPSTDSIIEKCRFCGRSHTRKKEECPAYQNKCAKCGKWNHFAVVCNKRNHIKNVKTIGENSDSDTDDSDSKGRKEMVYKATTEEDDRIATANMDFLIRNDVIKNEKCQLDTGATCNVIGYKNYCTLTDKMNSTLKPTTTLIRAFSNSIVKPIGRDNLWIVRNGEVYKIRFEIVQHNQPPLLSSRTCQRLGVVKICRKLTSSKRSVAAEQILEEYEDVFRGLGKISKEIKLEIDPECRPVIQKPRRVPIALRKPLKDAIADLVKDGIISKVDTHSDWVSNIVIVNRNDKLRICIDPIDLNKALKRVNYQMPTVDEILPELGNAKIFSTVDAKKGFWQLPLDENSSKLTTFWTPYGRYKWNRVPFGISPAPELYQMVQHEIVEGLQGVECICDDILIYGCGNTEEEAILDHNIKLRNLMQRLREKNLKLNRDKVKLCQKEVRFFGHVLTNEGVKPDPEKISAVTNMPKPSNVKETQTFLGMITYLAKYLPNLSTVAAPLRDICKLDSTFEWNREHSDCFLKLKRLVVVAPVLRYFNCNQPITIQCDASSTGLGSVLLQDGKPVAFASRTLTPAETNYAQIEKETLAILFSCMRFEQYIIGRTVIVQSDHKPLQSILTKPLLTAPKRLQRMLLALQRYNFSLEFVPGNRMFIADLLSRLHLEEGNQLKLDQVHTINKELEYAQTVEEVNMVEDLPIVDERVKEILKETLQDADLKDLTSLIISGFPNNIHDVRESLRPYFKVKDDLTTQNGLVFKGQRIVIPRGLRTDMLKRLHYAHSGIENSTKLARDTMYWPGIHEQLKRTVGECESCQKNSPNQVKEPMMSTEIPKLPYDIVSMDIMELTNPNGTKNLYLVTVDHYSDFFEIDEIKNMLAETIIKTCKQNFARHGIPRMVISDNGTHFHNKPFLRFAADWEFKFSTSSPYYPQSNGKAESAIKIAKKILKKARDSDTDIYMALLNWRNTPNKIDSSPVQRLFSRRTRCAVPMVPDKLKPAIQKSVSDKILNNKERAKYTFDRTTRKAKPLEIGEPVLVKLKGAESPWKTGKIIDQCQNRSYIVDVNETHYRRNRHDLKPFRTPTSLKSNANSNETENNDEIPSIQVESARSTPTEASSLVSPSVESTQHDQIPALTEGRPKRNIKIPSKFKDYQM